MCQLESGHHCDFDGTTAGSCSLQPWEQMSHRQYQMWQYPTTRPHLRRLGLSTKSPMWYQTQPNHTNEEKRLLQPLPLSEQVLHQSKWIASYSNNSILCGEGGGKNFHYYSLLPILMIIIHRKRFRCCEGNKVIWEIDKFFITCVNCTPMIRPAYSYWHHITKILSHTVAAPLASICYFFFGCFCFGRKGKD